MDILNELKQTRDRIDAAIGVLDNGRSGRPENGRRRGRPPGRPPGMVNTNSGTRGGRRRMSAAARKKISDAAKARGAKVKKAGQTSLGR